MDLFDLHEKGYQQNFFPFCENDLNLLKEVAIHASDKKPNERKNIFEHFPIVHVLFETALKKVMPGYILTPYCFFIEKDSKRNWPLLMHQDINLPQYMHIDEKEKISFLTEAVMFRLTLDATDKETGALKVIEGLHLNKHGETKFIDTQEGEVILFKPLLMHGSNKLTKPHRRRVFQALCVPGK